MVDYVDEHGLSEDSLRGSEQYAAPHGEGHGRFKPSSEFEEQAADRWERTTPGRLETVEPPQGAYVSRSVGATPGGRDRGAEDSAHKRRSAASKKAAKTRKRQQAARRDDSPVEDRDDNPPRDDDKSDAAYLYNPSS